MAELEKSEAAEAAIGCAIEVHRSIGPGLFETVYDECLAYQLTVKGIEFARQVKVPLRYHDVTLDCSFRADYLIARKLLIELKTVDRLLPVHDTQVLTYLRLLNLRQGLIINFNVPLLKNGLRSILNPQWRAQGDERRE